MEIRKIQNIGGSSLSVTLPKKWTEKHNLTGKDSLLAWEKSSGVLALTPAKKNTQARIKHNIHSLTGPALEKEVIALYILGFEEIEITSKEMSGEQRAEIRSLAGKLIGIEATESALSSITLSNLVDLHKIDSAEYLKKMAHMSRGMLNDSIQAFVKGQVSLAENVIERDLEMDKIDFLLMRLQYLILNDQLEEETLHLNANTIFYYNNIARQYERLADHAVNIAKNITRPEFKKSEDINIVLEIFNTIYHIQTIIEPQVFLSNNTEIHRIILELEKTEKLRQEILEKLPEKQSKAVWMLFESFGRSLGYLNNICEYIITHSFTKNGI